MVGGPQGSRDRDPLGGSYKSHPRLTNLGGALTAPHVLPKALCTTLVSSRIRCKGTGSLYVGPSLRWEERNNH